MLTVCEKYAERNNITFSTDENPVKSKTKVIYMCGDEKVRKYPKKLQLNGRNLPYVSSGTHLGHELSQACDAKLDTKIKRARYIDRTTDVIDNFRFAHPKQILRAVEIHCGDYYGSMLFQLFSESAEKYYRCWDRCVKSCWSVPLSTHKVFIKYLLSEDFSSVRVNILSRYVNFFQSLLRHNSPEVVKVANICV